MQHPKDRLTFKFDQMGETVPFLNFKETEPLIFPLNLYCFTYATFARLKLLVDTLRTL